MARDRRTEILDVAREVFLEQGYAAASMSAIAARLGGSKGTLYNYFQSKEQLFRAHIERECALSAEQIFSSVDDGRPIDVVLRDLARRYVARLSSEEKLRNVRGVIAEAGRDSEIGQIFYEAGPQRGVQRLAEIVKRADGEGQLSAPDPMTAAHQFLALCQGRIYKRRLFNVGGDPTPEEIEAEADAVIRTFMAAYGAEQNSQDRA